MREYLKNNDITTKTGTNVNSIMCRWSVRFSAGDKGSIYTDGDTAVHHTSDSKFHKICFI